MTRVIRLDEHVGRVQSSVLDLLDSPNCNLLVLSDVQVAVLKQMTFPYVLWSTRLVEDHESYQIAVDFPQLYRDELECLELLLSGGATMSCDLSTVLTALADAIRTQPSGGAGCATSGPPAVLNCLSSLLPEEIVPQPQQEAPEYGVPPEGFNTWEEYTIHKCKAAYAITDAAGSVFGALSLAPPVLTSAVAINTLLTGSIGGIALGATVFPPAALVAIAAGAIALGLLEGAAFVYLQQVRQYIYDNRDAFACALYNSGSAVEAQAAVALALDDAIQSVGWSGVFGGPLGAEIGAILGGIASQMDTTNLVNPLFRVAEDFIYPDVSCCGGGPPTGPTWHFTMSDEGWFVTYFLFGDDEAESYWANTFSPADPEDVSVGLLYGYIDRPDALPQIANIRWQYDIPVDARPVVVAGDKLKADFYCDVFEAAYVTLYAVYDDSSSDTHTWGGTVGWNEREIEATPGKTLASVVVYVGVAEAAVLRHFAVDNVRWGQ